MLTSNSNADRRRQTSLLLYSPSNSRSWQDERSSQSGQNTTVENIENHGRKLFELCVADLVRVFGSGIVLPVGFPRSAGLPRTMTETVQLYARLSQLELRQVLLTRDKDLGLDVRFISSLPAMQRPACTVWADKRPVQIVWAVR